MRSRLQAVVLPSEIGDFAEELHLIFAELGRSPHTGPVTGECSPSVDVYETEEALEITMDLPGVDPAAVRVLIKDGMVLVAGEKAPRRARGESSFHLVERGFGRFARSVRVSVSCDTCRARATLRHGELRITLPKIAERRGQAIRVPVTS